ncbi:hypothetical protein WA026_021689 [Henosepilachna vigintioctopunctata]|uniref:GRIP domain-containing protein n=1 Tax=Henosepilachna vigintioctopunctata TaxID=420089 RepID=A0AAW1U3U7_9CUCU
MQKNIHNNAFHAEDRWQWSTDESKTDQLKTDETITNLKKRIVELENENRDLVTNLDQLDQQHQENNQEFVKLKGKLEEELEIVTEKYEILNMKYNKLSLAENAYKKKLNEMKIKYEELSQKKDSGVAENDDEDLLSKYKQLEQVKIQQEEKIASLVETNTGLENLLLNTSLSSEIEEKLTNLTSKNQQLETEKKALRIALQSTKNELAVDGEKIREYETIIENLKEELKRNEVQKFKETDTLQLKDINSVKQNQEKRIEEPENELQEKEKMETEMKIIRAHLEELKTKLEESEEMNKTSEKIYTEQIEDLKGQLLKLNNDNLEYQNRLVAAEEGLQEYKLRCKELLDKIEEVHSKYYQIMELHLGTLGSSALEIDNDGSDASYLNIFSKRMEAIPKIILEYAVQVSQLDTNLLQLNESKTALQNEKNAEIERLMQNSEMLTQELLKRSQEIKDLEEECSQLMKNNDLLISKLSETKDTGLQTIYESNEDNVALFEKQLETANKKIEELERCLSDERMKHQLHSSLVSETIFEEEPKGLHQLKSSYEELKETLDLQIKDNERLQNLKEDLECKLEAVEKERDNCRTVIDKMRLDFETTEYQFSEMNINLETLSEEIEKHKLRIDSLVTENENLKLSQNDNERNDQELKLSKEEVIRSVECIKDLESKLEQLEMKYCTDKKIKNEEIENLEKELKMRSEKVESLQKEIEGINASRSNIQAEIEKLKDLSESVLKLYSKVCEISNIEPREGLDGVLSITEILQHVNNLVEQVKTLEQDNIRINDEITEYRNKLTSLENNADVQKELQDLMVSRNELIAIVQTKHQETLTYHAEIQRLSEILKTETEKNISLENEIEILRKNACSVETLNAKNEEIEKLSDQISFLREKCDVLAQNMLDEQRKVENEKLTSSEKEMAVSKKLERLQNHLMEVEEHYTQELLQSEQKIALLQARLNEVEQREKDSSTLYTSVSIRANQQNESLQQQLQSMTSQRDEIKKKLMDLEDDNNVKSAALSNLQLVLEQFQRDKEADVVRETDRIRRQVKQEQEKQEDLRSEIINLQSQLKESKQGLQAALRLTDQLEMSKSQISNLKETVAVLTEKLSKKEEELKTFVSQTDGKVDKSLVKNLVIGFVTSNKNLNKDQMQILKIIATVLDFNEQDHCRVNLNQAQQKNWLSSLLTPAAGEDVLPNESLSKAFVNFLEQESKPRVIPSLLTTNSPSEISTSSRNSSNRTTPTPIVLNEIILPTFSDFPQHRNSSSILKGVLKDNS